MLSGYGSFDVTQARLALGQPLFTLGPTKPVVGDGTVSHAYGTIADVSGEVTFDDSLDVSVSRTAGPPLGLTIAASAGAVNGRASADLRYRFVGLPPGWSVTSCKGFVQEQPVATRPESWGRLKAAYR